MTSQYQTMEIEWKPALDDNGNQILAKDKTPIVNSDPLVLTPSYQGQYGGFAFQGVDGIWSLPMGSPANALEIGIPVLVVLSLGGFKSTGNRYLNIRRIQPAGDNEPAFSSQIPNSPNSVSTASQQNPQEASDLQGTSPASLSTDTGTSIREQVYFKGICTVSPEIFRTLPADRQAAMLEAFWDTGLLLMRDSVRKRALAKVSPMVQAAVNAGAKIIEEDGEKFEVENLSWDSEN